MILRCQIRFDVDEECVLCFGHLFIEFVMIDMLRILDGVSLHMPNSDMRSTVVVKFLNSVIFLS